VIPSTLQRFFWETSPPDIDVKVNASYIIERLLEFGDPAAIQWLRQTYSAEQIAEVLRRTRSLSARSARFWSLYYDIPPNEVPCIEKSWHQRRLAPSRP